MMSTFLLKLYLKHKVELDSFEFLYENKFKPILFEQIIKLLQAFQLIYILINQNIYLYCAYKHGATNAYFGFYIHLQNNYNS